MWHLETIITLEALNYSLWNCCLLLVSGFPQASCMLKKRLKEAAHLCICDDDNHSCARPCLHDKYLFFTSGLSISESFFSPFRALYGEAELPIHETSLPELNAHLQVDLLCALLVLPV